MATVSWKITPEPDDVDAQWPTRANRFEAAVRALMADQQWHTRLELEMVGGKEATRRVRAMRRTNIIESRHVGNGIWEYRNAGPLPEPEPEPEPEAQP